MTTPALLFTAISLLISAYTSRFLNLATLLRQLDNQYKKNKDEAILMQIKNLRRRIHLIRWMQILGVFSFFTCVLTMFVLYFGRQFLGEVIFSISLLSLMFSLLVSLYEVNISVKAITFQLDEQGIYQKIINRCIYFYIDFFIQKFFGYFTI